MTDLVTPAGRIVQGKLEMQQRKDTTTKQPLWKDAAKTIPDMGLFFSLAFPKVLPNGQPNAEFNAFYMQLVGVAAAAWPQFFPQGAQAVMGGGCSNPSFSWKYQDGDGVDKMGQSVANKPGFKGNHIIKFDTNYPVSCFHTGQYRPDQEIGIDPKGPKASDIIKRGYWVIVPCEVKSNMANLQERQVPGIAIYPKLIQFLGGRPEDEIKSGPDAQAVLGALAAGWRPEGLSAVPGAPLATAGGLALPGAAPVPGAPTLALPTPPAAVAPVAPKYTVRPDLAAQGHTIESMASVGTTEQLVAAGYLIAVATPTLALPAAGGLALPGAVPTLALPSAAPVLTPPAPQYALIPTLVAQGVSMEKLIADGWTHDALVQAGHATKIG